MVESAGFNDRTWLDPAGHPHSERLRVIERFRRVDFGHVQYQITFDDLETLTKPLTLSLAVTYQARHRHARERVCREQPGHPSPGGRRAHGGATRCGRSRALRGTVHPFNGGSRTVAGFMGMDQNVTLVDGRLYLNALPLIALSATRNSSRAARSPISFWIPVAS